MLVPKFNITITNDGLLIQDITGKYSVNNTTGFGSPNTDIDQVTGISVVFTDSANVKTTYTLNSPSNLIYEGFFYHSLQALPSSEDIYKVEYSVFVNSTEYKTTKYYLIAPTTKSYLDLLYAKIEDKLNDNDLTVFISQVNLAYSFWRTLESLTSLEDNNNSKKFITAITRIANYNKCGI